MKGYRFIDEKGTFTIDMPENYSYQYFPVAGENGIKSLLTPNLGGDSKVTSFVPLDNNVEIMHVIQKAVRLPVTAITLFIQPLSASVPVLSKSCLLCFSILQVH